MMEVNDGFVTFSLYSKLINKRYDGWEEHYARYVRRPFWGITSGKYPQRKEFNAGDMVSSIDQYIYNIPDDVCTEHSILLWSAQKWLRDKHQIEIAVWKEYGNEFEPEHYAFRVSTHNYGYLSQEHGKYSKTYELALNEAISEALTLIRG